MAKDVRGKQAVRHMVETHLQGGGGRTSSQRGGGLEKEKQQERHEVQKERVGGKSRLNQPQEN